MKKKLKQKWIWLITLSIISILIASLVLLKRADPFDIIITKNVSLIRNDVLTIIFKVITNLIHPITVVLILVIFAIWVRNKKIVFYTLWNLVNALLINGLLKVIFTRERPLEYMLIDEKGYSFPSAHSMVAVAFFGFFIYQIWHTKIKKEFKYLYSILLLIVIIAICFSRIYLGVHYFTDVFAGAIISCCYLILFTNYIEDYIYKKRSRK